MSDPARDVTAEAPVLVVSALREEVTPLLRRARVVARRREAGLTLVEARLGPARLVVSWTGEGRRNAERGVERLLDREPEARLLVLGVAGGLSPGLAVGDLVVGERLWDGDWEPAAPDRGWLELAAGLEGGRLGTIATVDDIVGEPAAKAALWQRLGRPERAVVDMESCCFARVAAARRRPFVVVRAVSDGAEEAVPAFLGACRDPNGGIDRGRVVRHALLHPGAIPSLIGLRRRLVLAAERLADFVARWLARAAEASCAV